MSFDDSHIRRANRSQSTSDNLFDITMLWHSKPCFSGRGVKLIGGALDICARNSCRSIASWAMSIERTTPLRLELTCRATQPQGRAWTGALPLLTCAKRRRSASPTHRSWSGSLALLVPPPPSLAPPGKLMHGPHRLPKRKHDEPDRSINRAAEKICSTISLDCAELRKDLRCCVLNISIRFLDGRARSPHSHDHAYSFVCAASEMRLCVASDALDPIPPIWHAASH